MTAAEFQKDPTRRDKLATVLKNPVLREALDILMDELDPNTQLPATLADATVAAHRYHHVAGANHIRKGLNRLAAQAPEVKPLPVKKLKVPKNDAP